MNPTRGALGYLQLPTTDVAASIAFYEAVLGWQGESAHASFEAPGLIGQWTTELTPSQAEPCGSALCRLIRRRPISAWRCRQPWPAAPSPGS